MRIKIAGIVLILLMVSLFPIIAIQQPTPTETAKFVLASWDYPDEHGQGIESIYAYHNETGSWVQYSDSPFYHTENPMLEIPTGAHTKFVVYSYLNRSYIRLPKPWNQGHNYIRHNITVTHLDEVLFFQQNFTYDAFGGTADPVEWYKHTVILDFTPVDGEIYTATVDYEVYYGTEQSYYLNDCSSLTGISLYSHGNLDEGDYGISSDGDVIESWIMPDESASEGVIYTFNFTNIDNTDPDSKMNVSIRYKVEPDNHFYYLVCYNDSTSTGSVSGQSTSWITLNVSCDSKFIDYIQLYNFDFPSSTASGNLSAWVDYIEIEYIFYDWVDVASVSIYLCAEYNMWGYNTALIILGLIMIPASSLFLVWGGKNKMSSDKLFFGLIAFILGWGLLVGGIMP